MKTACIFSGQGAQKPGMGLELYRNSPAAAKVFARADEVLSYKISQICFEGPEEKLTSTIFCQPAIFAVSMAALAAWEEKTGESALSAVGCAGLSLGEYAALTAAGALDFDSALRLLAKRAEFMDQACRETVGTMAAVIGGDNAVTAEVCRECGIDIANLNCPGQTVISGEKEAVLKACTILKEKGVKRALPLNVAGAFHSRLMASAGEKLRKELAGIRLVSPKVPVIQNFTGKAESDPDRIRENLACQVAGSVRWEECVRTLMGLGAEKFIEYGPGNVLTGLVRRIDPGLASENVN